MKTTRTLTFAKLKETKLLLTQTLIIWAKEPSSAIFAVLYIASNHSKSLCSRVKLTTKCYLSQMTTFVAILPICPSRLWTIDKIWWRKHIGCSEVEAERASQCGVSLKTQSSSFWLSKLSSNTSRKKMRKIFLADKGTSRRGMGRRAQMTKVRLSFRKWRIQDSRMLRAGSSLKTSTWKTVKTSGRPLLLVKA